MSLFRFLGRKSRYEKTGTENLTPGDRAKADQARLRADKERNLREECIELVPQLEKASDYFRNHGLNDVAERFLLHACRAALVAGENQKAEELKAKLKLSDISSDKSVMTEKSSTSVETTQEPIVQGYFELEKKYHRLDDKHDIFNKISDGFFKSVIEKYSENQ